MQTTLNIFALTRSEKTSKDVSAFLDGVDGLVTKVSLQPDGVTLPDESALPDVLLYEVTDPTQAELTLLESFIAAHRASTTVLAIGTTSDTELLRRLMRAGVRDVVPSPLVRQEIVTICTNLLSDKRAREAEQSGAIHAVCAFMDAKGGSGATTIAVNVAAMLAQERKLNVCLIDFDLGFGACAHMLDLKPTSFLTDAVQQSDRLDTVFLKALMTTHSSGLHVLASPASPASDTRVLTDDIVKKIIGIAAELYDVVIVDLPRDTSPWAMEVVRASTRGFVVMQNTLAIIRDVKLLLDYMPHAGIDMRKIELINNRAMAKSQSVSIDQLKQALGRDRIHRVRNDYHTALAAADQGMPVFKVAGNSELTEDVRHLASDIWQTHEPAETGRKSFLAKLFNNRKAPQS
ncbi:MAG: CpaE family protein [Gammaproteobacteria bacterium]